MKKTMTALGLSMVALGWSACGVSDRDVTLAPAHSRDGSVPDAATGGAQGSLGGASGGTAGEGGSTGGIGGAGAGGVPSAGGAGGDGGPPLEDGSSPSDASSDGASADTGTEDAKTNDAAVSPIPILGGRCSTTGVKSCNGHAQQDKLICYQGTWAPNGSCATNERCDTTPGLTVGTCQPATFCANKTSGYFGCATSYGGRYTCSIDLIDTPAACSGSKPVCLNGGCVVCTPGAVRCSGATLQTCNSSGAWATKSSCSGATPVCDAPHNRCAQCTVTSHALCGTVSCDDASGTCNIYDAGFKG